MHVYLGGRALYLTLRTAKKKKSSLSSINEGKAWGAISRLYMLQPPVWEGFSLAITNRMKCIQLIARLTRMFLYAHWQHSASSFRKDSSTLDDSRTPLSTHPVTTVYGFRSPRLPTKVCVCVYGKNIKKMLLLIFLNI